MATRPGLYGNPFREGTAQQNVEAFRKWLLGQTHQDLEPGRRREILRTIRDLQERPVACFCGLDQDCHADVLCELANRARCVEQTTPRNCFRACVATVLDLPIELVPVECEADSWNFNVLQGWLFAEYRLQAVEITLNKAAVVGPVLEGQIIVILTITSTEPMTGLHSVVAATAPRDQPGFEILWDPHPDRREIKGELVSVMYFVPVAPLRDIAEIADGYGIRHV